MTTAHVLLLLVLVSAADVPDQNNAVVDARITQPPASRGGPMDLDGAPRRLADVATDVGLEWLDGIDAFPASIVVEFPRDVELGAVVLRWRFMPADYSVEVQVAEKWKSIASVRDNRVEVDKIAVHLCRPVPTRRLRVAVTATLGGKRRCGWRAIELYESGRLPARVQQFLERPTPCLYATPPGPDLRKAKAREPLDRELLDAPIPTWEPIPNRLYGGRTEGRRVNELAGRREQLLDRTACKYHETGRREYAAKARDVLTTIIDHYDRYQSFRFVGRSWQAVTFQDPAYRLTSMFRAYDQIAEALSTEEKLRFLYFALDLGDFQCRAIREFIPPPEKVTRRSDVYNWVPNSFGALAMAAAYLRGFPETTLWLDECERKFPGALGELFFLADGTWWECSPSHHVYVVRGMAKYALAKHLLGQPIWTTKLGRLSLADTFEALAKTANPLGEYPSVNDSYGHGRPIARAYRGVVEAATMMGRGDLLFAWRGEPTWPDVPGIVKKPIELRPPAYLSVLMPEAGQAVFRDGWQPDDGYLFFDYGPHGGGHGHRDKLSIAVVADGHHWAPDAACAPHYSIFPEQWKWHKQTIAHNTVLVDGRSQAECQGRLVHWHTDEDLDLVSAEHTDGYAHEVALKLQLDGKRHVLSLTPRELTPLRIAAVRLGAADGKDTVVAATGFQLQDASLVDDDAVPEKRAAILPRKASVLLMDLTGLTGTFDVCVLGHGADRSHDSVFLALDGRRLGSCGLGVNGHKWHEATGKASRILHRRTCFHPRGRYFLIHDTLRATDGEPHTLECLLHVYGRPAGQEPGKLWFTHGQKGLLVLSPHIGAKPIRFEKGLCGGLEGGSWTGKGYPEKGGPGWIYIPYFRFRDRVSSDKPEAHFWAVLIPFVGERPDASLELLPTQDGRHGLRLSLDDRADEFAETFTPAAFACSSSNGMKIEWRAPADEK